MKDQLDSGSASIQTWFNFYLSCLVSIIFAKRTYLELYKLKWSQQQYSDSKRSPLELKLLKSSKHQSTIHQISYVPWMCIPYKHSRCVFSLLLMSSPFSTRDSSQHSLLHTHSHTNTHAHTHMNTQPLKSSSGQAQPQSSTASLNKGSVWSCEGSL